MSERSIVLDGNEAAARIAHLASEVIAIYPITPASPMGEFSDAWSAARQAEPLGHRARGDRDAERGGRRRRGARRRCRRGALTTTFTASQGLLLMIPNMFKIAGELTPTVFHVAARTIATHALSIFGDHSDVMAARTTGLGDARSRLGPGGARLGADRAGGDAARRACRSCTSSTASAPRTRSTRSSCSTDDDVRALIDEELVDAHRARALNPDRPVLRGTAQNPDVFFQAREACNPFYDAVPGDRAADAWTGSRSAPGGATACSTTRARPTPSA